MTDTRTKRDEVRDRYFDKASGCYDIGRMLDDLAVLDAPPAQAVVSPAMLHVALTFYWSAMPMRHLEDAHWRAGFGKPHHPLGLLRDMGLIDAEAETLTPKGRAWIDRILRADIAHPSAALTDNTALVERAEHAEKALVDILSTAAERVSHPPHSTLQIILETAEKGLKHCPPVRTFASLEATTPQPAAPQPTTEVEALELRLYDWQGRAEMAVSALEAVLAGRAVRNADEIISFCRTAALARGSVDGKGEA